MTRPCLPSLEQHRTPQTSILLSDMQPHSLDPITERRRGGFSSRRRNASRKISSIDPRPLSSRFTALQRRHASPLVTAKEKEAGDDDDVLREPPFQQQSSASIPFHRYHWLRWVSSQGAVAGGGFGNRASSTPIPG